jgi:hypothetical protein
MSPNARIQIGLKKSILSTRIIYETYPSDRIEKRI